MMRRLDHFTDLGAFWGSKPERFLEELQVQNHKPTDSTGKPQTTLEEGQKKIDRDTATDIAKDKGHGTDKETTTSITVAERPKRKFLRTDSKRCPSKKSKSRRNAEKTK